MRKVLCTKDQVRAKIKVGFWSMCTLTCWCWGIYPLLEEEIRLPLAGWFPFDLSNKINFAIAYIFLIIGAWFNGICNIAVDTLLSALIMVVAAELTILNDSLENIRNFSEAELGVTFKNFGDKGEVSPDLQKIMNQKLIDCIVQHRNILRFNYEYQNVFSNVVLAQFVGSVVLICITMFEMALSTKLTYSAYHCSWENSSEEFKKNLLYFMTRSQVDIKILAGSIFTLNLSCFVTIIKSSWSYFAVLRSINN
ncbi:odorant receptor Or1-like [Diabrotica virgifera virgifera]|uniref:Uncharacterized protein n=1 Tax=Diabrotica virgifera virgifera TaxID=50390 RepID=A0ABM5JSW9_DIAVI|nr:odorant receptor Or1-like [Diabrotica virgifera virgifera]